MENEDSPFFTLLETLANIDENSLLNYNLSEDNLSENDYSDLDINVREIMESIDQLKCENNKLQKQNSNLKEINKLLSLFNTLLCREVLNIEKKHILACKEASFIITDLKWRLDTLNFDIKKKRCPNYFYDVQWKFDCMAYFFHICTSTIQHLYNWFKCGQYFI